MYFNTLNYNFSLFVDIFDFADRVRDVAVDFAGVCHLRVRHCVRLV